MVRFPCRLFVEVVENEEEECDTDLERQNVEELYDFVRHQHQSESQEETYDVQHKALIPVLRPYQRQAVNWMLRREKFRITSPRGRNTLSGAGSTVALAHPLLLFPVRVELLSLELHSQTQSPKERRAQWKNKNSEQKNSLPFLRRTNAAFSLERVDHIVRKEVILQPFHRLVRNVFLSCHQTSLIVIINYVLVPVAYLCPLRAVAST